MTSKQPAVCVQDIRIDDMAEPVITPTISAAREGRANAPDRMTVDEVLARATAAAGGGATISARIRACVSGWPFPFGRGRRMRGAVSRTATCLRLTQLSLNPLPVRP